MHVGEKRQFCNINLADSTKEMLNTTIIGLIFLFLIEMSVATNRLNSLPTGNNDDKSNHKCLDSFLLTEAHSKTFLKPRKRSKRESESSLSPNPTRECRKSSGCYWEELEEYYRTDEEAIKTFMRQTRCSNKCFYPYYCVITNRDYYHIYNLDYACALDGVWGAWSSYSDCSLTCGTGKKTKTRTCDRPAPLNGGNNCPGESTNTTSCQETLCPVDGNWSAWSNYSACSLTCGPGEKTRTRACDNPAPVNGGNNCSGSATETTVCQECVCPVDGGWGSWSNYSDCSVSCGTGEKTRTRICDSPPPGYGGNGCSGNTTECVVQYPRRQCVCHPMCMKNLSSKDIVDLVRRLKIDLGVDISQLSKTIRKKISIEDNRFSSQAIGVVGSVMLIIPILVIVSSDLVSAYHNVRKRCGMSVKLV